MAGLGGETDEHRDEEERPPYNGGTMDETKR